MLGALTIFSYLLIFALLVALAYRDIKEYILPDKLNAALSLTFVSFHILTEWQLLSPLDAVLGALMGGGLLYIIRYVANYIYKSDDTLGLGDVKLMAATGFGLGHPGILLALTIGAGVGLLHGLYMGYADRKAGRGDTPWGQVNVPAGFGLTVGIAIMVLYQFGFGWLTIK